MIFCILKFLFLFFIYRVPGSVYGILILIQKAIEYGSNADSDKKHIPCSLKYCRFSSALGVAGLCSCPAAAGSRLCPI